ncbi:hypothetical protein [Prosthecobacter sp.]|jgi:hypothetical protein|uniref:hypothetical protein n=1 Tax=Prosthecobacter sp. TaxID=1965333 RepID=UPI0037848E0F
MAKFEKTPTGEFHSGYGCVIIAAAVGVFGFILWWGYHSLTTMDREFAAIAQEQPVKLADVPPQPDLDKKIAGFAAAATAGKPASLKLSAAELNVLIVTAPDSGNGTYKDMLRVKAFDPAKSVITTDCSLPMNTAKFWEDKKRYLVGEIDFHCEITEAGPDAKVHSVRVPGKTLPDGMISGMQNYGYVVPYHTHPQIGHVLKAVKQVKVESDGVVLSTTKEP